MEYFIKRYDGALYKYEVYLNREKLIELKKRICDKHCKIIHHGFTQGSISIRDYYNMKFSPFGDALSKNNEREDFYAGDGYVYNRSNYEEYSYDEIIYPQIVLLIDRILNGDYSCLEKAISPNIVTKVIENKYLSYYKELRDCINLRLNSIVTSENLHDECLNKKNDSLRNADVKKKVKKIR